MLLQLEHLTPLRTRHAGFGTDHERTLALYRQALRAVAPAPEERPNPLPAPSSLAARTEASTERLER